MAVAVREPFNKSQSTDRVHRDKQSGRCRVGGGGGGRFGEVAVGGGSTVPLLSL